MERVRKVTQIAFVVVAVLALVAAGVRFVQTREPGPERDPQVVAIPNTGPVGMRPFLELRNYPDDARVSVYLCAPGDEEGPVEGCAELATLEPRERTDVLIPAVLPGEVEVVEGAHPLRVGPDPEDGSYPVRGEFTVVPFSLGSSPEPRSFAEVELAVLSLGEPAEIATDVDCRPRFTPDGRLVIGQTLFDPRTGVIVEMDVGGPEVVWSPDRDRVAMLSPDRKEIRVAEADGSDPTVVVREARGLLSSLSWSPEGDRIAYIARTEPGVRGGPGPPTVFAFNLVDGSTGQLGRGENVAWSPADDRLAVEAPGGVIELSDLAGGRTRLTEGRRPAWSPDGTLVAFVRPQVADAGELWVQRADGTESARLVAEGVCGASFSPGGNRMAVVTKVGEATTLELRAIRVE